MDDDAGTIARIHQLVEEEHRLERTHEQGGTTEEMQARLRQIEVSLDQCWDLLRQRRARREFGAEPDEAQVRPAGVVEGYQQ